MAGGEYSLDMPDGSGGVKSETVSMRNAMNEIMRAAYVRDCENGVKRWNKIIEKGGIDFELRLPSPRPHRPNLGPNTALAAENPVEIAAVDGGTMVVVEGPRFSTRAESRAYAAMAWSRTASESSPMPNSALRSRSTTESRPRADRIRSRASISRSPVRGS